ncbi:hypothetical protein CBR_g39006 [Chara braunii]|uniref:Uncharacterized protein n=1 Tax=Chara braunii TaxID=69332 RepID=A0A388K0W5_CHABU|nr:hypothetical protein CBR_g39006 [Chara braunii]|eukprot:GBG63694.1 hypothetical protein CBR_g39006 [Chara braunii]
MCTVNTLRQHTNYNVLLVSNRERSLLVVVGNEGHMRMLLETAENSVLEKRQNTGMSQVQKRMWKWVNTTVSRMTWKRKLLAVEEIRRKENKTLDKGRDEQMDVERPRVVVDTIMNVIDDCSFDDINPDFVRCLRGMTNLKSLSTADRKVYEKKQVSADRF